MSNSTFFMEKSFVVATLMVTKSKHLQKDYVTFKEVNNLAQILTKEFAKKGLNVCINDVIDTEYFEIYDDVILKSRSNDIDLIHIKSRYQGYCPSNEVLLTLWDDNFIYNSLEAISAPVSTDFIPRDITKIIEEVLDDPNSFYEKVANKISKEEYYFLADKLGLNRYCKICTNRCFSAEPDKCDKWKNDVLIGKAKISFYQKK